ncbi:MAG: hypothetical protein MUO24_05015 [Desulfobacterales bacterium]|nr:hypothetical protein [Desulfobacterales bacterium]
MAKNKKLSLSRLQIVLIILTAIFTVGAILLAIPKSIPDRWVYLTSLLPVLLFLLTLWEITHSHVIAMRDSLNKHVATINVALALENLNKTFKTLASLSIKYPVVKEYLGWLVNRHESLLDLPSEGIVKALDSDYFGFAALVFHQAKTSVRSTSLVDPHWYDSGECTHYTNDQVKVIIQKQKVYTRYFIVNPNLDTSERKSKTVSVIKSQAEKGFDVAVVHTANYEREYDAAVIDDGAFWILAKVPKESHRNLPEPEITGCECFFRVDSKHVGLIHKLQGYFDGLESRVHVRFNSSNMSSASIETVY